MNNQRTTAPHWPARAAWVLALLFLGAASAGAQTLSIDDVMIAEGDFGTKTAVLTVTLSGVTPLTVTVDYFTQNDTAAAGEDYKPVEGNLVFTSTAPQHVAVPIFGDLDVEADETFVVLLQNSSGATIADGDGVVTLLNDDDAVEVSIDDTSVTEGDSGMVSAVFNVVLSRPAQVPVTVGYFTRDATATAGEDYQAAEGTVTVPAGRILETIEIDVLGDTVFEDDETFDVVITGADGAFLDDAEGKIFDDDQRPTLAIGSAGVLEGDAGTTGAVFNVTLSGKSSELVTVSYASHDGTATAASGDYQSVDGSLIFEPGQTRLSIVVEVAGDTSVEDDETFFVDLSDSAGAEIADGRGEGTILNDDQRPPGLAIDDVTLTEGDDGTRLATFTVTLMQPEGAGGVAVAVDYATRDGTATAPGDYSPVSGTLTFESGQGQLELVVEVAGDTDVEDDETFFVDLSNPSGAEIVDGEGKGTIVNDDVREPPVISIDDVSVVEGDAGTSSATFTVELSRAPEAADGEVSIDYATQDGTATVAGGDYLPAMGTLTFAPGQISRELTVEVAGDTAVEDNETFSVLLSGATGATLGDGRGEATIANDDQEPPAISIDDVSVIEGNDGTASATFTVALSNAVEGAVSVDYAAQDGTATAADGDYLPAAGTLTFTPGQISRELIVEVAGDTAVEDDETFTVALSNPMGATIADGRGEGTIYNDDEEPSRIRLLEAPAVAEGAGTIAVSVERFGGAVRPARVTVTAIAGTATAGEDFVVASREIAWGAGDRGRRSFELEILDDNLEEDDETLMLRLSSPVDSVLVEPAERTLVILDDDTPMALEPTGEAEVSVGVGGEVELEVRATRDDGAPVEGATVVWSVEGDGELLDGERTPTDGDGLATQRLRLGGAGGVVVTATIEGADSGVEFMVTVESRLADAIDPVQDPGDAAVAEALDESCPGATGEFGEMCDYLIGLDGSAEQRSAIAELTPEEIAAQAQLSLSAQKTQLANVGARLAALRGGATQAAGQLAILIRGRPLDLGAVRSAWTSRHDDERFAKRVDEALAAALAGGALAAGDGGGGPGASGAPRWGLFLNGRIALGDRPTTARETGFDFETLGLTFGADYRLSDRLVLGGALGYLDTDTDLDRDGGKLDARGTSLSAYGSYTREKFYLDGVLGYGRNEYDLIRNIDLPQPFQGQRRYTALGSPDGSQLSASLGAGYDTQIKRSGRASGATPWTVGGYGSLSWIDSDIDDYTERDAGPFNLAVAAQDFESLLSEAGVEVAYAASRSWGVLRPTLRLSYLHEFEDDARLIRALFVEDVTANQFVIPTDVPDRDFFNVTAGLTATLARGRTLYLIYDTDLERDDLDVYTFTFGARFELK